MAHTSAGPLLLWSVIVLAASVTSGSSFSKDASHRREVEVLRRSTRPLASSLMPAASSENQAEDRAEDHAGSNVQGARRRAKRCTCYTYKDKECVYYCHLDIIWINTPERSVPYGMSSYQTSLRRRRSARTDRQTPEGGSAQRCVCTLQSDSDCSSFCGNKEVPDLNSKWICSPVKAKASPHVSQYYIDVLHLACKDKGRQGNSCCSRREDSKLTSNECASQVPGFSSILQLICVNQREVIRLSWC